MATSKQKNTTSQNQLDVIVRQLNFKFDSTIPKYWFKNNPTLTLLACGLSAVFPEGEIGFIRSVRHFQPRISNKVLLRQLSGFIGQEAHHGKEHRLFNEFMARFGLPTTRISNDVKAGVAWHQNHVSPERFLANTCALEHFTAMFAEIILSHPEMLDGVDDKVRALFLWHAIEESEHKAVAFDVFQDQVDDYWIRVSEMALTTLLFTGFTVYHWYELMYADRQLANFTSIKQTLRYVLGKKGFLRGQLPKYLAYYRRDFHPNEFDATSLRENGLALLAQYLPDQINNAA